MIAGWLICPKAQEKMTGSSKNVVAFTLVASSFSSVNTSCVAVVKKPGGFI